MLIVYYLKITAITIWYFCFQPSYSIPCACTHWLVAVHVCSSQATNVGPTGDYQQSVRKHNKESKTNPGAKSTIIKWKNLPLEGFKSTFQQVEEESLNLKKE